MDIEIGNFEARFVARDERIRKIRTELAAAEAARQADERNLQKLVEQRHELAGEAEAKPLPRNPAISHLKMRAVL